MSEVGFVVIEYNQASHWPSLEHETLYDTEDEARERAEHARAYTEAIGRGETYAVARVELVEAQCPADMGSGVGRPLRGVVRWRDDDPHGLGDRATHEVADLSRDPDTR